MTSISDESGVLVRFPLPERRLFRNRATEDLLLLCLRHPHEAFTITEIREITGHGGDTTQTAVDVLESADLVETRRDGRSRLVTANRDRFFDPDDPLLAIPQEAFRDPVGTFLEAAEEAEVDVVGVILFGSVARGEADRVSDIDLQVIVGDDRPRARRALHDVRQRIEDRTFDGERYELQLLVESVESATRRGADLQEIFREGITLYRTDTLDDVQTAVFHG